MKMLYLVPLFLTGLFVVHALKMMRFYLVLLEQKISVKEFLFLYIKTTFINLLIPFKLGEVYRIFCVVRFTKCLQIGILSVVLDRFFDTFILLLFLIPYDLVILHGLTWMTGILLVFLLFVMLLYRMFEPTYLYLNEYMIRNSKSKRGIFILSAMEMLREWYDYIKDLIKGRQYLIIFCSALGWITEFGLLWLISRYDQTAFGLTEFADYIQSIFSSEKNHVFIIYNHFSMYILFALILIFLCFRFLGRRKK
ncbi:lysylphosphatidylglycerol synthase domain-containing protein [Candidatus Merdisoma sp. JLR.KK006]|uniref:lysylphosphatidylglycerol synthase domain-containing protein n=1 Tax=Candidatus Merdisoma sp. JLR.KK006 TaxID=3112626 RepID=UPI002FF287BB